jgi:hypothetical protein
MTCSDEIAVIAGSTHDEAAIAGLPRDSASEWEMEVISRSLEA